MAVKKKSVSKKDDIIVFLKQKFDFVVNFVRDKVDEIIYEIKKRIVIVLLYFLGVFFILLGVTQLIDSFIPLNVKGIGALGVGLLILVIGLIYNAGAKKK